MSTRGGFAEPDPEEAAARRVSLHNAITDRRLSPDAVRELLGEALRLTAEGRIRPSIGATFPLERAREAHLSLEERRTVGKSLLLMTR
ncbi:zinc-binding dehydrogenase [Nonomuraea sp. NPDC050310]|uniref:zinc-binding dehydrogenase n=1 Tax=Nonomuraea sp. NPDC050310 TaxID=3154935 RepID=UPI0033EDE308